MTDLLTPIQAALDLPHIPLTLTEAGALPPTFAVTELASASIGADSQAVAQLIQLWDPVAGDYASADGWIRLHTNAPHHRAAAERVLGKVADRTEMGSKVASWNAAELEQAVVDTGGCAAQMRSWQA